LLAPVLPAGVMMLFEIARMALVVIVGTLAFESALQSLRVDPSIDLVKDDGTVAGEVRERMLDASYGYLQSAEIAVRVNSYADLATFGAALSESGDEETDGRRGYPVLAVEVTLNQEWISALPALIGIGDAFTHVYRQLLGNLYQAPEDAS